MTMTMTSLVAPRTGKIIQKWLFRKEAWHLKMVNKFRDIEKNAFDLLKSVFFFQSSNLAWYSRWIYITVSLLNLFVINIIFWNA